MSPTLIVHPECMFLGRRVQIRHRARLEAVRYRGGKTYSPRIVIGDYTTIEQDFHLACAESVVIGRKVAITERVGIFDIWHRYDDVNTPIVDQPLMTSAVSIGDHSLIGMGAVIQPGVSIGRHCVIGANSVVTRSVPDYSIAAGVPAITLKRFDACQQRWVSVRPPSETSNSS